MSLVGHYPASNAQSAAPAPQDDQDYWHGLIDEEAAAAFLGLSKRTMQSYRLRGCGPRYVALSSRCLRYRRIDLKAHADSLIRTSTSDPGQAAA
jgi:hypothetical protein